VSILVVISYRVLLLVLLIADVFTNTSRLGCRNFAIHLTRDLSILAPNFTVELVDDGRAVPVDVDLNFYRGFLAGQLTLVVMCCYVSIAAVTNC